MSLFIKNKLEQSTAGNPTISDKYHVVNALVDASLSDGVYAGMLVDLDDRWTHPANNKNFVIKKVSATTKHVGVVIRDLLKPQEPFYNGLQRFKAKEQVPVAVSGFITALAGADYDGTNLKTSDGLTLLKAGTIDLSNKNLRPTGNFGDITKQYNNQNAKWVELEII